MMPPKTTTDADRLEIHILGAGKGESIILSWPGNKWGVVDCYAPSLNDPNTNPTLQFLTDHGVTELEFLCLTHPHDDHFRGMSQLLQKLKVLSFWRFAGLSGRDLKLLAHNFRVDAERSGSRVLKENANDFVHTMSLVKAKRDIGQLRQKNVTGYQQLYPIPVDDAAQFQVWSFAPSGNQSGKYEEGLASCFDKDGRFLSTVPHANHNYVSVGLLVQFGKTRVVLGGDVEGPGWDDACLELKQEQMHADAVKVSHHGSDTGYIDGLWEILSGKKKPIAVIAPYFRFKLPKGDALAYIRSHAEKILLTCKSSKALRTTRPPPVRSRAALHARFKIKPVSRTTECGRCTLVFDSSGNCITHACVRPAYELTG